jgi:hypothetical protein
MNRNEQVALLKMYAPSSKRKGIWREGVLQIWVTRACDRACSHCTQNSQFSGKAERISVQHFEQALQSIEGYFGVVGMFGGNPAIHPEFYNLCKLMEQYVPFEQRGIWCNHPLGKGSIMRGVFNPAVSNLNVHQSEEAHREFVREWPESIPYLKGLENDSRHSPPLTAMSDLIPDDNERWKLISNCDINRYWSSIICVVRGELRAYFCEIAGAQAMLHQYNQNWAGTGKPMPDTGLKVEPGWWKRSMVDFAEQVRTHCHHCGIPLKGYGQLANSGTMEQVTAFHKDVVAMKTSAKREVRVVENLIQLGDQTLPKATDYLENGTL